MTDNEILQKIEKLEKVIKSHYQKSMRAQAGRIKTNLCSELTRRFKFSII